jgi:hypothetical protein
MGIRNLNKFFREECKNSDAIKLINMKQLAGKKIVVDISIYLYKFTSECTLIDNMYSMLSIFRYYNIIPIFVFDGKAPAEKKNCCSNALLKKKQLKMSLNN